MLSTGSPVVDAVISVVLALGLFGGLFVLALVCWGWRIPNYKVVAIRVEIVGRPIEDIFEAIQNVEEFPKWLPHVQRVRSIPPGRLPKGAMAAYIVQEDGGAVMMMDHTISSPMLLKRSFADKGLKCVWTYRLATSKSGSVLVALEERTFLESALYRGLLALLYPKIDMAIKEHLYFLKTGPCGDREVGAPEGSAKAGTGSLDHLDRVTVDESASELRKRRPIESYHYNKDGLQHGSVAGSAEQQGASSSRVGSTGTEATRRRDQSSPKGPNGAGGDSEADTGGKAMKIAYEEMKQG